MTQLISKENREALGIDTIPRGILWSILLLSKVTKSNNNEYKDLIKYATNPQNNEIVFSVKLPYKRTTFINNNGDLIVALESLSVNNENPVIDVEPINPSNTVYYPIPDDDPRVNTLEKYLLWLCLMYKSMLYRYKNDRLSFSIRFFDQQLIANNPTIEIEGKLLYSFARYVYFGNLLESVFEIFSEDQNPFAYGLLSINQYVIFFGNGVVVDLGII